MLQFTGPWMDFPIPNEVIRDEDLSKAASSDKARYAKLVLIKQLRESADYTKYLPSLNACRVTENLKNSVTLITKPADPNYYQATGTAVLDSFLFQGIQTFDIDKLPPDGFPTILFRVGALVESNQIFDAVFNRRDILPMVYWVSTTRLLDTANKTLSDLGFALYDDEGKELRQALLVYGVNVTDLSDLAAIEAARQRIMYNSEGDYYQVVMSDKIGFFGSLGGVTNPVYRQKLSEMAVVTDNRAQFAPSDIVSYLVNIGEKDFINYRFKIVDINGVSYLQVQWRFPQAEYARAMSGMSTFEPKKLVAMWTKKIV